MEFIVPKFINREPKIVGPLTFKQFLYIGIPGLICLFLYFIIGKKNPPLFILIAIVLMAGGLAFGFLKIKGHPLPVFLKNFFTFSMSSKIFIWRRKIVPPKIQKIKGVEEKVMESPLKIAERSHLQKTSVDLQTRKK
jgi:hypothetical protein